MPKKKTLRKTIIQRYYRNVVAIFIFCTIIIIGLIAYFSFSETVIEVRVKQEPISSNTLIEIVREIPTDIPDQAIIQGVILEKNFELTKEFTDLTTESEAPAKATGTVTLYNNYSKNQPLIATTRLLSDSGILFRTDETVTVPVGGKVEVSVTADQPGKDGEIGPTHFTIPGLWLGIQDKIYGESTTAMTGGTKLSKIASQEDIVNAKNTTFQEAYTQAMDSLETELNNINADYKIQTTKNELVSETVSVEPDTITDLFTVTTKVHIVALSYDKNRLDNLALEKIQTELPEDYQFTLSPEEPFAYTIDKYNVDTQSASLRVTVKGMNQIALTNPIFDRINLVNGDRNDIMRYFEQFPQIESVEVHFSPFWVFRASSLEDHIEIRLK